MTFDQNHQTFLRNIFQGVDRNNDEEINAEELQKALSNGTWVPFNMRTIEVMIKMFDRRGTGTIRLEEFGLLWKYVVDWQQCFQSFDKDSSGFIDLNELQLAFQTFGYRLSPQLCHSMLAKFDRQRKNALAFDDFIHCCIMLHNVTDAFRNFDTDRDGIITIGYEQFLQICLHAV